MFYCGTSGFSYEDWVGIYYPDHLPKGNWLSYYSQEFNAVEVNSTYYSLPSLKTMESMVRKTGSGFLFSVKIHQELTHVRQQLEGKVEGFIYILKPLIEAQKLGCILAQFPYSFRYENTNMEYLRKFRDCLHDLPLVIEFRNDGWLNEDVYNWMKSDHVGYCCVDEPRLPGLMPPVTWVTGEIAYLRFHGRNSAKWWHHEKAWERYDYSYKIEELKEWLPGIQQMSQVARNTFIFANNHWRAQAVDTIRQVRSMLDQLVL